MKTWIIMNSCVLKVLQILTGISVVYSQDASRRVRGVSLTHMPLYSQNDKGEFTCFDNSLRIPFDWLNDDYCDCSDGSDEPGTAACSKGHFYCANLGHKSIEIPSSRVNDQICDCCDGSDEWAGYVKCPNFCAEAGKAAREEAERQHVIQKEGFDKKSDLIRQGGEAEIQSRKKLEELKAEKAALSQKLQEIDTIKQAAEKIEREAKDAHMDRWKAELEEKKKIKEKEKAVAAFEELDSNKDNRITLEEAMQRLEFDKNLDGRVEQEELQEYFGGKHETDVEHFANEIWDKMKHIYKPKVVASTPATDPNQTLLREGSPAPVEKLPTEKPVSASIDLDEDGKILESDESEDEVKGDEVEDFEKRDEKHEDGDSNRPPLDSVESEEKMPDFDENTKKLIEEADKARKDFEEIDRKNRDLDDEIRKLDEFLAMDLGSEREFSHLHRQCFEYSDAQYIYGLCVFDRTYQKSKAGHGDVSLGTWGSWSGSEANRYAKQSYKNGLACWNGPARSTEVTFKCGSENKLVSASEPGRCEYAMEFLTPAACSKPSASPHDEHLEL